MKNQELVILLVEDDEGHAYLIRQNLQDAGVANRIVHLPNGQEALDYVHRRGRHAGRVPAGPLLVLLDINMPLVTGEEVLRQLKADPTTDQLPVVVLTTTDDPREVDRCYGLGCSVYITKPVQYQDFVDALTRLGMFLEIIQVPGREPT